MRALLITLEGVKEVHIGTTVERTRALITDQPFKESREDILTSMYRLMDCRTVTGAGYPDESHACWADDEALNNFEPGCQITEVDWYDEPLVGKLLITGFDAKTGDTTAATMTVAELESKINIRTL